MTASVLMYHAVYSAGYAPVSWDPHYAVSDLEFRRQLTNIKSKGFRLASVLDASRTEGIHPTVCVTFDDGGSTDVDVAFPILAELGATADFFVSSDHVGRTGFASWDELSSLAKAGMSIQSHGHSHRLLNDLKPAEIRYELETSKGMIEDKLGLPVSLFAPPGGRLPRAAIAIAIEVGYSRICCSRPGVWRNPNSLVVPRFAVLSSTSERQTLAWAEASPVTVGKSVARYAMNWTMKKAMGNQLYNVFRSAALHSLGSSSRQ